MPPISNVPVVSPGHRNVRLRNVMQWLDHEHVVPPESRISLLVALGFFVICLINTIGLLLAKFLRRRWR